MYLANITENAATPTPVVTITASDLDLGLAGQLRYSIPKGIAQDKFKVDAVTGMVSARAPLDREERDQYVVTGE